MDEELEKLLDQLEADIDPGGGGDNQWYRKDIRAAWKRIKGEALWLDAPTCEGWWWKKTQYNMEVVFIQYLKGGLWMLIHGEPWRLPSAARWFGPLVPPER